MADAQRYRDAEQRLWEYAGATPTERRVPLPRNGVNVRIQEVGDGPPALFIHGGPSAGSAWATLAGKLHRICCLIVDRPGAGLSDPLRLDRKTLPGFAAGFVADVLDALEISRAHVVANSFGGHIALRSAAAHPDRVERMVLLGCPAFVPGMGIPPFMRLLLFPGAWRLMSMLPPNERANRIFTRWATRQMGSGASLDAGRIPRAFLDVFTDWSLALQRDTDTARYEVRSIASLGGPVRGFDPSLTLSPDLLRSVKAPTFFFWGASDTFGGPEVARAVVALMPNARLELLPQGGHLPWFDDIDRAADATEDFLLGSPPLAPADVNLTATSQGDAR